MKLSVRPMELTDLDDLMNYWFTSGDEHLIEMGVDLSKMPTEPQFRQGITHQINLPMEQKNAFAVIWEVDGKAVGHSNTNPTKFGETAKMHLHLWKNPNRQRGLGTQFVKMTIPLFFEHLKLKTLVCEPYASNPAPNKTMAKIGFQLIKEYITIPGSISTKQAVKRWEMNRELFEKIYAK